MINKLEPGKRYRVTTVVEGVADKDGEFGSGDTGFYTGVGVLTVYGPATSVEEIEPEYVTGHFYRDASGYVYLHRAPSTFYAGGWTRLCEYDGSTHVYPDSQPKRPLVELELKEKSA